MKWLSKLTFLATMIFAGSAAAQNMTVVVPFAPGGSADAIARIISDGLRGKGIDNIVENRPGAGGTVGSAAVATADPDGSMLLVGQIGSHVLSPVARPNELPYDPVNDLTPVVLLGYVPTLFIVRPGMEVENLQEFVDLARETVTPPLNFGSSGIGTNGHVTVEMLKDIADIEMTHVPYGGIAPILTDMLGGRIDSMIIEAPGVFAHLESGIKPLVIVGPDGSDLLPGVQTTVEAGFPDWNMQSWYGLFVTGGTPEDVVAELEATLQEVIATPEIAELLAARGLSNPGSAADLKARLDEDFDRFPPIFRDLGIIE